MLKMRLALSALLFILLGVGCSAIPSRSLPTPSPTYFRPSVIGLTVQAGYTPLSTPTPPGIPEPTTSTGPTETPARDTPTTGPAPTSSASNPTALISPLPSETGTTALDATPTSRPSRTPTITPTLPIPVADIQISDPGPMSRVISPLRVIATLHTMPSGSYHVEVWIEPLHSGQEVRLLYREVKNLISKPADWVFLDKEIEFELSRVSEFGQLRLSVYDQYGRPFSVNSINLILLSMGTDIFTPRLDLTEPIVIHEPTSNHLIQGGMVTVSGMVKPSQKSMLIQLTTIDGTVVGYSDVFITPAPDGSYVPFTAEVPYQVDKSTWVRLTISEDGTRIPGIEHLSSVEVFLSP